MGERVTAMSGLLQLPHAITENARVVPEPGVERASMIASAPSSTALACASAVRASRTATSRSPWP
jgi:hypothetical protein